MVIPYQTYSVVVMLLKNTYFPILISHNKVVEPILIFQIASSSMSILPQSLCFVEMWTDMLGLLL